MACRKLASGTPAVVAGAIQAVIERGDCASILVFDDLNGAQVDLDISDASAAPPEPAAPAASPPPVGASAGDPVPPRRAPGRPKLGVVGREVTLLPRHWEWLNAQPGGASVALRKLVEQARRDHATRDQVRRSQEAAFRFMSAMTGNEPGFEEASRALFGGDRDSFDSHTEGWQPDVREYARRLAAGAFGDR